MAIADQSILDHLEPIAKLSAGRKKELAALCFTEKVNKDIDPTRMNVAKAAQALYLLKGDLSLHYYDDKKVTIHGGTEAAQYPVNADQKVAKTVALTEIEILRIDMDLLDIMMTWDQLSSAGKPPKEQPKAIKFAQNAQPTVAEAHPRSTDEWLNDTEVFSAFNLQSGVFSRLPAANIEAMFKRMTTVKVAAGQVVIQQGGQGDYYYLIQNGIALVSR
ncbi:MAG: cyclic nucleotide-binding domain-containing protein, partial [Methylotenera sp.]|uniref:cyclic nucleotide-binding domain-containing protein n=1 Tax=Methylotenera sp. TaxID=2051956 RepID=UPI00180E374A